ncbi:WD40 repeat-like protein [Jaminaea rosea]|uniref:WD40 repeat-like protein n=1 Tax=Jaminaea rosea TaxID=1569628 RepID=A0A316UPZ9_9BASI|nr:WD40 repeat-like protein [Jaminaea rosea]PWN27379.1 WD40 repeat-like protein [Jaminaea rosea]
MSSPPYTLSSVVPPNPTTVRGQSTKLDVSPNGDRLVYTNGRSVIIRPFPNNTTSSTPAPTIIYSQHAQPVSVARISPSGAYCASADSSGLIRIWDILGSDQTLKAEYRPFAGAVRDLAWDGESKRLAVVGQGKERFGHFFFVDSGASCGEVSGHAKVVNSVALRAQRPFRAVAGGDDNNLVLYNGVPFKYASTIKEHARFVQAVAYSKDGSHFASVGSDGKVLVYEGASGEVKGKADLGAGTIFDVKFAQDGKTLLTSGADGFVRSFSVPDCGKLGEWDLKAGHGNAGDQLVGLALSSASLALALNLAGELITFDPSKPGSAPSGRHVAPTKGISAALQLKDGQVLAASWDGNVYSYRSKNGGKEWSVQPTQGYKAGGPVVTALSLAPGGDGVYAVGMDDVLRRILVSSAAPQVDNTFSASLPCAARGALAVDSASGIAYIASASSDEVLVLSPSSQKFERQKVPCTPTTTAVLADSYVAIGTQDGRVLLYEPSGKNRSLAEQSPLLTLERNRSAVTHLSFQPLPSSSSGNRVLTSADGSGKILLYSLPSGQALAGVNWVFHSSRVDSLSWLPSAGGEEDGVAVSGGLDTHLYLWERSRPMGKRDVTKNSHAGGVGWVDFVGGEREQVISAGSDGALKVWRAPAGK